MTPALRKALASAALAILLGLTPAGADGAEPGVLVGPVTPEEILAVHPEWMGHQVATEVDREAAAALATVEPGAEIEIVLGTWCSDSAREVPRFWRALDEAGGLVAFSITYVGVDRDKREPADVVAEVGVTHVPVFVVKRDGREVGRVVETSPHGLEVDLLALLRGEASGLITASEEVLAEALAPPEAPRP